MVDRVFNVLFLCTGNSARSIIGECLANRWGQGKFRGYSAGSHPKGEVHPLALQVLRHHGYSTGSLHSKHWNKFARSGAPGMDFIFTVCDNAAAEQCPVWPGQPLTVHWGIPDPAAAEGDEKARIEAFQQTLRDLENRIKIFINLPFDSLDKWELQKRLDEIGQTKKID